jgi:YggT family protein
MPSLIGLLSILIQLLQFLFFARFIAQIIDMRGGNPITRFLVDITDPILAPFRRILPSAGGLDFSPMIVLFLLIVHQRVIASSF